MTWEKSSLREALAIFESLGAPIWAERTRAELGRLGLRPRAAEQLLPLVYDELRQLAAQKLSQEKPGQTLQATALVHEAWLRLVGEDYRFSGARHFFLMAAEAFGFPLPRVRVSWADTATDPAPREIRREGLRRPSVLPVVLEL